MTIILIFIITLIFLIFITVLRIYELKKRKKKFNNLNANYFLETLNKLIEENKYNLIEERMRLKEVDAYGNEDLKSG